MGQSLVQIYVHIIFSTKDRRRFLADDDLRERTHDYLAGICRNQDSPAIIVGGAEDHVHILCRLGKQTANSELVRELKRDSSSWIKTQRGDFGEFHWQKGYGAFSVSPSHVDDLKAYIAKQMEHHCRESFQEEFRRVCAKYGVEIDERYVWD
jgi:REP element-mobilizing transposase RayT